jgi:prepilin-type N-terminal cleavage/methylation domain-containing protein
MFIAPVKLSRSRGFTLLEITLAVAILASMAVAIYRFVQVNLISVRVSSEASEHDARYGGLRDLLTAQWQSLPGTTAALTGEPFKFGDRQRDEIKWTCAGGPGLLTRYAPADFTVWLKLQRESKKSDRLDLGFLRKPKEDAAVSNADESWIPLIEDVGSVQIRYFDPRINGWVQRWTETGRLPRLVKIVIGRNDAAVPWEMIIPLGRSPY